MQNFPENVFFLLWFLIHQYYIKMISLILSCSVTACCWVSHYRGRKMPSFIVHIPCVK